MKETRKGMLLVISGPSGAGKGNAGGTAAEQGSQFLLLRQRDNRGNGGKMK